MKKIEPQKPLASDQDVPLAAPLAGWLTALADVPDPVFSGQVLGNGLAIDPFDQVLKAPCDGVVAAAHRAHHAVTLSLPNGAELLLHIGLDTVSLGGEGFTLHVSEGQEVRTGDPLISFDMDVLAHKAKSLLIPVIVMGDAYKMSPVTTDRPIALGEALFTVSPVARGPRAVAGTAASGAAIQASPGQTSLGVEVTITDPDGIHARPAGLIAERAKTYSSKITFAANGKEADALSPVKLMLLGLGGGDKVRIAAQGTDADAALKGLAELVASFGAAGSASPAPAAIPEAAPAAPAGALPPLAAGERAALQGVQAVSGLAVGTAVRLAEEEIAIAEAGSGAATEGARLRQALETARADLAREIEAARPVNRQQAEILKAHQAFLDDPDLIGTALRLIDQGKSAAFAWKSAAGQQAAALRRLGNARLAERAVDLQDVERRLLIVIAGKARLAIQLPAGSILIADDLLPSQLTGMDTAHIAGLCLAQGGPTSHVAILAASLGIPTLVAMGPELLRVPDGASLFLDADHRLLTVNPPTADLETTAAKIARRQTRLAEAKAHAAEDCHMADGRRIEVVANLASPADALIAVANGAEGCGLLRSEFLFLDRATAPTEEEQLAQYQAVADSLEGRPLIIRTLDAGADKVLPYLGLPAEANPALGLRGIRTSLWKPETLRSQLRAILRVRPYGQCRIMIPMVATLDEVRTVRAMLDKEREALGIADPMPLGIMVEVPSAAVMADIFAPECDFFSIGTNDLTQYALAMDRMNPHLAKRVDAFDPAVLRLIAQAAAGAAAHGRWTSVCGGLASIPLAAPVLIGLGVTELSATASAVPEVKAMVRSLTLERCQAVAREVLARDTADAVHRLLTNYWPEV